MEPYARPVPRPAITIFQLAVGLLLVLLLVLLGGAATALEYRFGGTIRLVTDELTALDGARWSASFVLDPARVAASNESLFDCGLGRLNPCVRHTGVMDRVVVTVADETIEITGQNEVRVEDGLTRMLFDIQFQQNTRASPAFFGATDVAFGVSIRDPSYAVIQGFTIPDRLDVAGLDLSSASAAMILFRDPGVEPDFGGFEASVDTFEIVPEPGTAVLLGLGLGLVASGRKRKR